MPISQEVQLFYSFVPFMDFMRSWGPFKGNIAGSSCQMLAPLNLMQ